MKKLIALLAFLCLAVGITGAQIDTKKLEYTIPYIPVEQRSSILPKHNVWQRGP